MKVVVSLSKNLIVHIEDEDEVDALAKGIALAGLRRKCNECESTEGFHLTSNKSKGFTFINNKCDSCGAKSKLGQYKEGGYFWHDFEKYEPKEKEGGTPPPEGEF